MKISVLITTILIAQVSGSFFDVFHGAVLSVQNSFGKLISDVATDVKDTFDCTVLAVEHVLSLSTDATTRYYDKCATNKIDSTNDIRQEKGAPKIEVSVQLPNNEEYLEKVIPAEIESKINETLSKILGNPNPQDKVLDIENELSRQSEKLSKVNDLVKNEMDKISNEVDTGIMKIKLNNAKPSVENILNEIKLLEEKERTSRNISEANEIHFVVDEVLDKLDGIEQTEVSENMKLQEILKELESNSNSSFVGLRQHLEQWKSDDSKHLNEIKSKIEEHDKKYDHPGPYYEYESNHTQPVTSRTNEQGDVLGFFSGNLTHAKETLNENSTSRMIADNIIELLTAKENLSSNNSSLNDSKQNNSTITSIPLVTGRAYTSNTVIERKEDSTLHPNQFTNNATNVNNTDSITIVMNSLLPRTKNHSSFGGTIQQVNSPLSLYKRGVSLLVTTEPPTILSKLNSDASLPTKLIIADSSDSSNNNIDSGKTDIDTIKTTAAERMETDSTSTRQNLHGNNLNDTRIISTDNKVIATIPAIASNEMNINRTLLSTKTSIPLNVTTTSLEPGISSSNTSTVTPKKIYIESGSVDAITTTTSSQNIERTPVTEPTKPFQIMETTTIFDKVNATTVYHSNSTDSMVTSTLPYSKSTTTSENRLLTETITASGDKPITVNKNNLESSFMAKNGSFITSNRITVNGISQVVNSTTDVSQEFSNMSSSQPTGPPTSTFISTISEIVKNTTSENAKSSSTLVGYNSTDSVVTSTQLSIIETTIGSGMNKSLSTKKVVAVQNEAINETTISNDAWASTTFTLADGAAVSDNGVKFDTATVSEQQNLSSIPTLLVINDVVTRTTEFASLESKIKTEPGLQVMIETTPMMTSSITSAITDSSVASMAPVETTTVLGHVWSTSINSEKKDISTVTAFTSLESKSNSKTVKQNEIIKIPMMATSIDPIAKHPLEETIETIVTTTNSGLGLSSTSTETGKKSISKSTWIESTISTEPVIMAKFETIPMMVTSTEPITDSPVAKGIETVGTTTDSEQEGLSFTSIQSETNDISTSTEFASLQSKTNIALVTQDDIETTSMMTSNTEPTTDSLLVEDIETDETDTDFEQEGLSSTSAQPDINDFGDTSTDFESIGSITNTEPITDIPLEESIETVVTSTDSEQEDVSPTSTQSDTIDISTSTDYTPTENFSDISETENESTTLLEDQDSTTPEMLNNHNLDIMSDDEPQLLTISGSELISRNEDETTHRNEPESRPNMYNHPNYIADRPPPIHNDFIDQKSSNYPYINHIDTRRNHYEYPPFTPKPAALSRLPNFFNNLFKNANRPTIDNRAKNSFSDSSQKVSSEHQRALREALQLIQNSKRSERIINSAFSNGYRHGARNIFNR